VALFDAMAMGPYSALIPDSVPSTQFGIASGWMGFMTMSGSFLGGGLTGFILSFPEVHIATCYVLLGALVASTSSLTVLTIHYLNPRTILEDIPLPSSPSLSSLRTPGIKWSNVLSWIFAPFQANNFKWVFIMRFLMNLGVNILMTFTNFFMKDVVREFEFLKLFAVHDGERATSYFVGMCLVGSLISTASTGIISDQYGRKVLVYFAGTLLFSVPVTFMFNTSFPLVLLMGMIFGVGYGSYVVVDWALASSSLPNTDSYAKDMGLWHAALALPMMIGPLIDGVLIDNIEPFSASASVQHLGWKILWLLSCFAFLGGTLCMRRLKDVDVPVPSRSLY